MNHYPQTRTLALEDFAKLQKDKFQRPTDRVLYEQGNLSITAAVTCITTQTASDIYKGMRQISVSSYSIKSLREGRTYSSVCANSNLYNKCTFLIRGGVNASSIHLLYVHIQISTLSQNESLSLRGGQSLQIYNGSEHWLPVAVLFTVEQQESLSEHTLLFDQQVTEGM